MHNHFPLLVSVALVLCASLCTRAQLLDPSGDAGDGGNETRTTPDNLDNSSSSGEDDDLNPWIPIGILAGTVLLLFTGLCLMSARARQQSKPRFKTYAPAEENEDEMLNNLNHEPPLHAHAPGVGGGHAVPGANMTSSLGYAL